LSFTATQISFTVKKKRDVDIVKYGNKIFTVWTEEIDTYNDHQIFLGILDLDTNISSVTQITSTVKPRRTARVKVYNNKVYVVYLEQAYYSGYARYNLFLTVCDLDGSNITITRLTDTLNDENRHCIGIHNDKIYLTYEEYNPSIKIAVASCDLDGSNFTYTLNSVENAFAPTFVIDASKLWVTYSDDLAGGSTYQIFLASCNLDGSGWITLQKTNTNFRKRYPVICKTNDKFFWCWEERDANSHYQLWTAESDLTGENFIATQRTFYLDDDVQYPKITANSENVFVSWAHWILTDTWHKQIFTGTMDINGENWSEEQNTSDATSKFYPCIFADDEKLCYGILDSTVNNVNTVQVWIGIISLYTPQPLVSDPPIILSPIPIRCAKPMVILQAPTPVGAPWLLHFKLESFSDTEGTIPIAVVDSSINPELFEYSTDNGLIWTAFPETGLPPDKYDSLVRARCEVGPRQQVWLKASVGAEDA